VQGEGSLPFSVRKDEVVTGGKVDLSFAYSPALIPDLSHLTVLINGEVLGSIPLPKDKASGQTASLAINPGSPIMNPVRTPGAMSLVNELMWSVRSGASS